MKDPKNNEIERLRSILRNAHKPRQPRMERVLRKLRAKLGRRIPKKAAGDRGGRPSKEDAA